MVSPLFCYWWRTRISSIERTAVRVGADVLVTDATVAGILVAPHRVQCGVATMAGGPGIASRGRGESGSPETRGPQQRHPEREEPAEEAGRQRAAWVHSAHATRAHSSPASAL